MEDEKKKDINKEKMKRNVIKFAKYFGVRKKNAKKRLYLSKIEATIAEEGKKIADVYKAEEEQQLKDLLLQERQVVQHLLKF